MAKKTKGGKWNAHELAVLELAVKYMKAGATAKDAIELAEATLESLEQEGSSNGE